MGFDDGEGNERVALAYLHPTSQAHWLSHQHIACRW